MKSESFLTLHREQHNYHVQGPETYVKDIVKIVTCDVSGSTDVTCDYCCIYELFSKLLFLGIFALIMIGKIRADMKQSGRMIGRKGLDLGF